MARRALLIVNTQSRGGEAARDAARDALVRRGIEPLHRESETREALSPLIVEHAGSVDMILVAGGDGTINAAAAGVLKSGRPLGIIPAGTANDLARTLGVPADIEQAADVIAGGRLRKIDVGLVNDVPFFNVASIGLSVELTHELTSEVKRRWGKLGYAVAAMRALSKARPFRARIVGADQRVRVFTLQIAVGNGVYYGGGSKIEETAEIDAGELDLYSLEFAKAWRVVLMLRALRYGVHGSWKEVRSMKGQSFEIRTRRPRPVNADGEIVTETPARFSQLRGAVEVFVPAEG